MEVQRRPSIHTGLVAPLENLAAEVGLLQEQQRRHEEVVSGRRIAHEHGSGDPVPSHMSTARLIPCYPVSGRAAAAGCCEDCEHAE